MLNIKSRTRLFLMTTVTALVILGVALFSGIAPTASAADSSVKQVGINYYNTTSNAVRVVLERTDATVYKVWISASSSFSGSRYVRLEGNKNTTTRFDNLAHKGGTYYVKTQGCKKVNGTWKYSDTAVTKIQLSSKVDNVDIASKSVTKNSVSLTLDQTDASVYKVWICGDTSFASGKTRYVRLQGSLNNSVTWKNLANAGGTYYVKTQGCKSFNGKWYYSTPKVTTIYLTHVHNYVTSTVAATCTEKGYTLHTCTKCGTSYKDNYTAAKGHTYGSYTVTKAATCSATGTKTRTCSVCGNKDTATIAKLSHSYKTSTVAATCTEKGYTLHTCTKCGTSYKDNYTAAKGHTYGSYTVTKAATCSATGTKTKTCSVCGNKVTATIAATGEHDYVTSYIQPYDNAQGYTLHTCVNCGYSYKDNYVSKGLKTTADEVGAVTIKSIEVSDTTATITFSYGENATGCRLWLYNISGTNLSTYSNYSGENTITITGLTADTMYTFKIKCFMFYYTDGTSATKTTQWSDDVYSNGFRTTKSGTVTESTNHTYKVIKTAATCTTQGYTLHTCTKCGYSYKDNYVSATGHTYGDWTVTKEATCLERGSKTRTCSTCGYVETETIGRTTHAWGEWVVEKEPTLISEGRRVKTCSVCGARYAENIDKLESDVDYSFMTFTYEIVGDDTSKTFTKYIADGDNPQGTIYVCSEVDVNTTSYTRELTDGQKYCIYFTGTDGYKVNISDGTTDYGSSLTFVYDEDAPNTKYVVTFTQL